MKQDPNDRYRRLNKNNKPPPNTKSYLDRSVYTRLRRGEFETAETTPLGGFNSNQFLTSRPSLRNPSLKPFSRAPQASYHSEYPSETSLDPSKPPQNTAIVPTSNPLPKIPFKHPGHFSPI